MTGQMPFRVPKGGTVFTGVGGPSLIAPGRLTLPSMLRDNGYATACVGKWHIGMTFVDKEGQPVKGDGIEAVKQVDFSRRIEGGPVDHGFDRFFGTACCRRRIGSTHLSRMTECRFHQAVLSTKPDYRNILTLMIAEKA